MINKKAYTHYRDKGFTWEHWFPGEYLLMVNTKTMHRARLYLHGGVWETTTGEYRKVEEFDGSE